MEVKGRKVPVRLLLILSGREIFDVVESRGEKKFEWKINEVSLIPQKFYRS